MTARVPDGDMSGTSPTRRRFWWLRWAALAVVVVVLGVEVVLVWPKLTEAWGSKDSLHWWWLLPCILAAAASMDSFAQVQRALFRSAGVRISQWQSLRVVLASNSISQTMPGGQVLAPAFVYRRSRKWGASPVVASWQLVMSGLLMAVGLAVLGLGGALLAGAKTSPFSVIFSVAGFIAFALVAQYVAGHPDSIRPAALRVLKWINHIRDKPDDYGARRVHDTIEQVRAVQLTRRDSATAFGWSLFNWIADVACLAFACAAVDHIPSISGLMVAYAAGKAVGTAIPLLPGGLGVVDGVLVPALTSAGMSAGQAVTSVLVYRLVSYLLVAAVGWVVIFFNYRSDLADKSGMAEYEEEMEEYGIGGIGAATDDPPDSGDAAARSSD
ncbi:lysylphosphatidylglycerol synthase transmembrane domain-containing protein [Gordonia jinhuaensis]|nr:lysylphosphatidylglycerol synthase transmembrane domain-containing protein [Gordonia jinhuaensis]